MDGRPRKAISSSRMTFPTVTVRATELEKCPPARPLSAVRSSSPNTAPLGSCPTGPQDSTQGPCSGQCFLGNVRGPQGCPGWWFLGPSGLAWSEQGEGEAFVLVNGTVCSRLQQRTQHTTHSPLLGDAGHFLGAGGYTRFWTLPAVPLAA